MALARRRSGLARDFLGFGAPALTTSPAEPKPDLTPSPETTLAEAHRILRGLPVDPLAEEHRDQLRDARPR